MQASGMEHWMAPLNGTSVPIVHKTKYIPPQNAMKANNVIISGIPEDKEEGTDKVDDKINALLNNLEVTVSNFQAKRIGKESTSKSRPILVELANRGKNERSTQPA